MRAIIALALYVSLAVSGYGQISGQATNKTRDARKYLADGEYEKAEMSLRALLKDETLDARHLNATRLALADLLREEGRPSEAVRIFAQVLAIKSIDPNERMNALSGLADIECHDGTMEASLEKWNETLAIARGRQDSLNEANALRGLAVCWLAVGQTSNAEPLLRRALKLLDDDPAAHPWDKASTFTAIAECYRTEGKFSLAEDSYSHALEIDRQTLGPAHPQSAFVMEQLAIVYASIKRFDLARSYAAGAQKIMLDACGEDSLAIASSYAVEGEVELRANNPAAAAPKYALALSIVRKHPASRSFAVRLMQAYSSALKMIHRGQEANVLNEEIKSLLGNPA